MAEKAEKTELENLGKNEAEILPSVNIYAAVKKQVFNGTNSHYFLNALLDLNSDLPMSKALPETSCKKIRCNSLK